MKPYKQLASEQRYQIYGLKQAGLDQSQIALYLGVNKSTISRELNFGTASASLKPIWRLGSTVCSLRYSPSLSLMVHSRRPSNAGIACWICGRRASSAARSRSIMNILRESLGLPVP